MLLSYPIEVSWNLFWNMLMNIHNLHPALKDAKQNKTKKILIIWLNIELFKTFSVQLFCKIHLQKEKVPCWFRHEHAKYTFALYLCLNSDKMTTIKHTDHGPLWVELTVFGFRSLCSDHSVMLFWFLELSGKLWFLLSPQGWVKPVQVLAAGEEWEPLCLCFK